MRRKRAIFTGAGIALAGVLVTAAIALGSGTREISSPMTIHVKAVGGHAAFLQLNPNKNTAFGDQFVISAPLTKPDGMRVGRLHADCTFFDKQGVAAECTGTFFLHGGQVVVRGPVDFGVNNRTSGSVLGGNGRYRNARGQVIFQNSTGNTEGFILELEP
jgi:dirigent-like protein